MEKAVLYLRLSKEDIDKIADEIREALNLTPVLVVEYSRNYGLKK